MKITVAIIYHDAYEKYLPRAVESVKQQDCKYDVEILTINNTGRPLSHGCNKALKLARGDFFIRLDADDYLHPNALQIMADILAEGEWDAVYPDFWEVDETGRKVGYNSLYESPEHNPLGAGVMFWTRALREIGGYDESIDRQEAYEMMKRFREAGFKIYRLEIPLYYRTKHGSNMSSSVNKINRVRRIIEARDAKILCAITAKGSSTGCRNKNRRIFKDSMTLPEIAYYTATQCPYIDEVVIITDEEKFAHELNKKGYKTILEGDNPTKTALGAIASVVDEFKEYDVIIQYQPTSPFVRPEHLTEAIEKLFVNKHDSVVSIKQMTDHPVRALQIVGNEVHPYGGFYDDRILNRQDLPDAFKFNGAFYVRRRYLYEEFARKQEGFALGNSIGFVLMGRRESVDINDEFDWELAKFIAEGMQPLKPPVKVAIVGSEEKRWTPEQKAKAKQKIREILKSYDNPILVSGGCHRGGVDIWAEDIADSMGIEKLIFPAEKYSWYSKGGFRERNIKIAETCDVLYDIEPKGKRSGGTWTLEYAEKLGKPTHKIEIE